MSLCVNTCSYSQKCHTTYTTDFVPEQEEKCEENFKKNCFIEYREVCNAHAHGIMDSVNVFFLIPKN